MVNLFETVKVLGRSEAVIRKLSSVERFQSILQRTIIGISWRVHGLYFLMRALNNQKSGNARIFAL